MSHCRNPAPLATSATDRYLNLQVMAIFEVIVVAVLILLNGVLAMAEMSIASSRAPKLRAMADQGVRGARRALALAADPARFLSTVQIGITLIGILAGAVSGASLGQRVEEWLIARGMHAGVAEVLGFGLVIGSITYVSLVIGELVPKQIALRNAERIACLVAPPMTILAQVSAPIVWLLSSSGRAVLKLLGLNRVKPDVVTDAEIHSLIAEAEAAGVIEPEERSMISGVMRLGDRPVRSVMVPRTDVVMIEVAASISEISKLIADSGHSRFVVYRGKPDNILGVLQTKDVSLALLRKRKLNLARLVKKAPFILDTMDALDVVERLKEADVHFGLVCDEYGHFEGIVTSADILEAIVGAFQADQQGGEPPIVLRNDGSFLIAGWTSSDLLADKLAITLPAKHTFNTAAGFALHLLGRLPVTGDFVEHQGYRFEVVDLDGRRIDKLLVTKLPAVTRRAAV